MEKKHKEQLVWDEKTLNELKVAIKHALAIIEDDFLRLPKEHEVQEIDEPMPEKPSKTSKKRSAK